MASQALQKAKIARLIELINHVPKEGLPDLGWAEGEHQTPTTLTAAWSARVEKLHPKVREFMGPISIAGGTSQRYQILQQAAQAVRQLADRPRKDRVPDTEVARFQVGLGIDPEGKIKQIPNLLLQCLEGTDADRIRRCRCKNMFWAKRNDQTYCTPACANRYRTRKSRGSQLYDKES